MVQRKKGKKLWCTNKEIVGFDENQDTIYGDVIID